ncbi:MAG: ATP-dependent DNA helicase, partial [Eggerthellaceae bacterium]|nr:ATP-dependent DNA helicase [Eggerthellaceae bacterium]
TKKVEVFEEQFVAESFDVGAQLQYSLYDETRSVVYASATLDSDDNFASFSRSVGLADDVSPSNVPTSSKSFITCKLGSSYRYDDQMKVFVVDDLPPVNTVAYIPELSKMLIDAHVALGGSMLTLFTNKKAMNEAYELTKPALDAYGLGAICQGRAGSKKSIIDSFLADETLSLFATKSFWEGFDAPGDTLRGVVITRLPFSNPSSPLALERKYRYSDDWSRFSLPAAIIEFKQAAGRLIRTADDHGVLILTDSRLVTQRYGKRFLNALPSKNITQCSAEELPQLLEALK